jgi:O-antigen ligase
MGTILEPKQDYNYYDRDGRKAVMERGVGYMGLYPVFGIGIANFNRAECTISPKISPTYTGGPLRCTAPHNSYVQAGAEMGFPGLLMWISLVFGLAIAPLRIRRRLPKSFLHGTNAQRFLYAATSYFAIAAVGFAVTSFFVSFAWMDPVYFMAALGAGLYIAAQAEFATRQPGAVSGASPLSTPGSSRRIPGWRVGQSALRAGLSRAP